MIIFGVDALDKAVVEKFECKNLMQASYGQTDISEFKLPKTIILWSSFLTGKNMEDEIKEDLWEFTLPKERTFFNFFSSFKAIDVPAFSLKQDEHALERKYLSGYFKNENTVEEYDSVVLENHEKIKKEFLVSLDAAKDYEIIMVYFDLIDAIGHLSFGIDEKIGEAYKEIDGIVATVAKAVAKIDVPILIISDHGMKRIGKGRYGDHTMSGFWSVNDAWPSNKKLGLNLRIPRRTPKITDFYKIISRAGVMNG